MTAIARRQAGTSRARAGGMVGNPPAGLIANSYGKTVSLRADVLNLFDNPLFLGPVSTYGTSKFGQITSVGGFARAVQFQARVGW